MSKLTIFLALVALIAITYVKSQASVTCTIEQNTLVPTPFSQAIPGGMKPGRLLTIRGTTSAYASFFFINLQTGSSYGPGPQDAIQLHVSFRITEQKLVRSHWLTTWGAEEIDGGLQHMCRGGYFEVQILCTKEEYKITVNGNGFYKFRHRMDPAGATHLYVKGDVAVQSIGWDAVPKLVVREMGCQPAPEPSSDY